METERADARLMAEIDSNRLREDELLNAALTAAGVNQRVGGRTPLSRHKAPVEELKEDIAVSESDIDQIAEQFIRDAENNGYKYTEDARLMLYDKIRENPENFMN